MKLARNGHLSDLTLERLAGGESPTEEVSQHLQSCSTCSVALDALRVPIPIPPFEIEPATVTDAARKPFRLPVFGLALVAILGVGIAYTQLNPPSEPSDGVRLKGSPYSVTLYAKNAEETRPLQTGAVIAPGERVGFQLENREDGYIAIIGVDATNETYSCFPQQKPRAEFVEPAELRTLPEAIRFDSKPGQERIVSIWCPEAFEMSDALLKLKSVQKKNGALEPILPGCLQSEVILVKE